MGTGHAPEKVRATFRRARTRWQTISQVTRLVVFILLFLLIAARLAAPYAIQRYVNRTLNRNADYGGRVGRIHLHLFRGAYSISHLDIEKKSGKVPVPFVSARTVDFSVEWKALFHGKVVSKIFVDQARVNVVVGPTSEQSQTGAQKSWAHTIEQLYPFDINRCDVQRSELWYHDFNSSPPVHIYVTNMVVVATNLSNARPSQALPADIRLHGTTIGQGDLALDLRLDPVAQKPTFKLTAALTNLDLTAINNFFRAYAKADVRQGRLDVYSEVAGADGRFEGYLKPLTSDLKVFNVQDKNAIQVVWEAVVAFVAQTFKNHPNDRFGTKIPFSGTFDSPSVNVWQTIVNVLKNTFVHAIQPGIDESVSPQKVRQDASQQGSPSKKQK